MVNVLIGTSSNSVILGVMAARGLLANPALFLGYSITPPLCVLDWIRLSSLHASITHDIFKRLITFMTYSVLSKQGMFVNHHLYDSNFMFRKTRIRNY